MTAPARASRVRVTDLSPAQWRIMFAMRRRAGATIAAVLHAADACWDDLTDLESRHLVGWTGEVPCHTAAGKTFLDVDLTRTAAVVTHVVVCSNGARISDVRRLAYEWTLLTDARRAGWLEIRNSETGDRVHRPSWDEAMQFGGWDLSIMRVYANPSARPYAGMDR